MEISEAEFERAARRRETQPYAVTAEFDKARRVIAVGLSNGAGAWFPADKLEGLAGAADADLAVIAIDPDGFGLSFPELDADFSLPGLLAGVFGSPKWIAALAGGGEEASAEKREVPAE